MDIKKIENQTRKEGPQSLSLRIVATLKGRRHVASIAINFRRSYLVSHSLFKLGRNYAQANLGAPHPPPLDLPLTNIVGPDQKPRMQCTLTKAYDICP